MFHHIAILISILGLGGLYWFDIIAIASGHRAAQRALSLATPWLLAGAMLLLYVPGFIQFGFSILSVVTFCWFFGTFVLVAWMQAFVLPRLLARLPKGVLLMGVATTISAGWEIWEIYVSDILQGHITAPITGVSAFLWLILFLFLGVEPLRSCSSRRS